MKIAEEEKNLNELIEISKRNIIWLRKEYKSTDDPEIKEILKRSASRAYESINHCRKLLKEFYYKLEN